MTKLNTKKKACLACVMVTAAMIALPICCCAKSPEKQFICGGKTMLSAIPAIAKKYTNAFVKKVLH